MIFTDKVKITPITNDVNYGTRTEGIPIIVKARVENNNRLSYNFNGKKVISQIIIFLEKATAVNKGDRIQVLERWGETVTEPILEVLSVFKSGAFKEHHIEVMA